MSQTKSLDAFSQFAKGKSKKKAGKQRKGVIYTRVSSYEQLGNTSLETQLLETRALALQEGVMIVKEFGGTYESAKSDDERKEFKGMLTFVNRNPSITDVYVYDLSRFSRTGGQAIAIVEKLKQRGVNVRAVMQPSDGNTPSGTMLQGMTLLFSKFDNDLRREKTIAAMQSRLKKGYFHGNAPLGYENVRIAGEKNIAPDGKKSKLIKLIFKWKAKEGISNEAIRARLKTRGWNIPKTSLSQLIRNPVYCGILSHSLLEGETVKGVWEPLVSKALFLKANDVNNKNVKGYKTDSKNNQLPLTSFLKCPKCHKNMVGYLVKTKAGKLRPKPIPYYKCNTKGCAVNISGTKAHNAFHALLTKYSVQSKHIKAIRFQLKALASNWGEEQIEEEARLKLRLKEVQEKIEKLETKFVFDEIPKALYQKHLPALQEQEVKIEADLRITSQKVSNLSKFIGHGIEKASKIAGMWENGDYQTRQTVQHLVFPQGIAFSKEKQHYLTPHLNLGILLIETAKAHLAQKNSGQISDETDLSASVASPGIEPGSKV